MRYLPYILLLVSGGCSLTGMYLYWDVPFMQPDSYTYLNWAPHRTAGYPAFMELVALLPLPFETGMKIVQSVLLFISALVLVYTISGMVTSLFFRCLIALAIGINPFFWQYGLTALSEAPFFAFVLLSMAAMLHACRGSGQQNSPALRMLVLASAILGLATLVRPVGIAFLPALLIPALSGARWKTAIPAVIIPFFLILGAAGLLDPRKEDKAISGHGTGSVFGQLIAYIPEQLPSVSAGDMERLNNTVQPFRQWMEQPEDFEGKVIARLTIWNPLNNQASRVMNGLEASKQDIVIAILKDSPEVWLYETLQNYYAMWIVPVIASGDQVATWEAATSSVKLDIPDDSLDKATLDFPSWFVNIKKVCFASVFLIATISPFIWLFMFVTRRKLPQFLIVLAAISVGIQAYFIIVAAFNSPLPRYQLAVWPLQVFLGGSLLFWLGRYFTGSRQSAPNQGDL